MANRTATAVLEKRGAFKMHPERKRPPEPENKNPLGSPPDHFTDLQREAWMDVARDAAPGVLSQSERLLVEQLARLVASTREPGAEVLPAIAGKIDSLLGKLGMTPADRPRVGVEPPKRTGDFDGF